MKMKNLDKILKIVSQKMPEAGIDCLLIGGFAVNHYGYTRNTLDVDFMIVAEQLDRVREIMSDAGFTNIEIRDNIAFFTAPEAGPRVDFLRVDSATMSKLLDNAVTISMRGNKVKVPSLKDLLAMKIFSFAQNTARRMGKDLPDIAYLSVLNKLATEEDLKPLCDKFGTSEIYKMIQNYIEGLIEQ